MLAALVVALRKAGAQRELLQAAARQFAKVSWTAMVFAVATGVTQVQMLAMDWGYGRLHLKLGLAALVVVVALAHQLTARRSSAAVRGIVQLVILTLSLAIFGVAVHL